jgi:hypothetical protein
MLADIRERIVLFEVAQDLPACPSGKGNIKMKISMDSWWKGTGNTRSTVPWLLCPPQISHGLPWNRARASVVRDRRMIGRPIYWHSIELQFVRHREQSLFPS